MKSADVGIAMQGGGAYAAFAAGVLPALCGRNSDFLPSNRIRSISGTSGGALNALMLGLGIHEGLEDPCDYLTALWERSRMERALKERAPLLMLIPDEHIDVMVRMAREANKAMPLWSALLEDGAAPSKTVPEVVDAMVRAAAPSLLEAIDQPLLANRRPFVTVAATEVRTTQAHYFTNNHSIIQRFRARRVSKYYQLLNRLSLQGVYASMAHPLLFKPMTLGKHIYWDGYYVSNPPFLHLLTEGCTEIILIRLIPHRREDFDEDADTETIRGRVEEIIQSAALSHEVNAYYSLRERWLTDRRRSPWMRLPLIRSALGSFPIYHEIRMYKPGGIGDEAFPLSGFVDKLIGMGERVMKDENGFINHYRRTPAGHQVVSEVSFDTEEVTSYAVDLDALLASE